jgi:hypothetical protein
VPSAGGDRVDAGERAERAFLVLCVALPAEGRVALGQIDPEQHITSSLLRRAARHLAAGRTEMPLTGLPPDDEELARVLADLVQRAGRAGKRAVGPDNLQHTRLMLELARIERGLRRARAEKSGEVEAIAREREAVKAQIGAVVGRLEEVD